MTNNYYDILQMTRRICKCNEYEDLAHHAIESFLIHPRKEEIVDSGKAMQFLSGIIYRSFHSNTSPYYTLYHQKGRVHLMNEGTDIEMEDVPYDYELDRKIEAVEGILEEMMIGSVEEWFRATLFKMWVECQNFSEIHRRTKIPRTSISNAVNECIEYIKTELKNRKIS